MGVLDSASGNEIFSSSGDIFGQLSFSTRSTLTDLDVLPQPRVYLSQRGENFTSEGRIKYDHSSLLFELLLFEEQNE